MTLKFTSNLSQRLSTKLFKKLSNGTVHSKLQILMEITKLLLYVTIRPSHSIKWFSLVWLLGFYLVKTHDFFFFQLLPIKKRVEWQKFYNFWSPVASVLKLLPLSQTAWLNTYSSVSYYVEIISEGAMHLLFPLFHKTLGCAQLWDVLAAFLGKQNQILSDLVILMLCSLQFYQCSNHETVVDSNLGNCEAVIRS